MAFSYDANPKRPISKETHVEGFDDDTGTTVDDVINTKSANVTVPNGYTNVMIMMVFLIIIVVCMYIPGIGPGSDDTTLTYPIWASSFITTILMTMYSVNTYGASLMSVFASLVFVFALPNIGLGLILGTFPGWITPFSNTIGYFVSNMIDGDAIGKAFKQDVRDKITQFAIDPAVILNSISPKDIGDEIKIDALVDELFGRGVAVGHKGGSAQHGGVTPSTTNTTVPGTTNSLTDVHSLIKGFVVRKDRVAYAVWVFLISSLTSTIAARMITDSGN